jgi:hypothetical protein
VRTCIYSLQPAQITCQPKVCKSRGFDTDRSWLLHSIENLILYVNSLDDVQGKTKFGFKVIKRLTKADAQTKTAIRTAPLYLNS